MRALIDGYAAARPLTAAERAAFGAELRFAACRFAVTRITDVHLKRDAGAAPGKDFQRYLAAPRARVERRTSRRRERPSFEAGLRGVDGDSERYLRTMLMYLRSVSLRSSSRST